MNVANRAAEYGGEIISDTDAHDFSGSNTKTPIAIRILEDTVINAITSDDMTNMAYYDGAAMSITSPIILANIATIQLTSGAVQLIFGEG